MVWVVVAAWVCNMNLKNLQDFLVKSAASKNRLLKKRADDLLDTMVAQQQFEQVTAPEIHGQGQDAANKSQKKDEVDALILPAFQDLAQAEGVESSFGKAASAYMSDVAIKDLPKATQTDIARLIPVSNPKARIVQYGMVVDELLPKVDSHNFEVAEEHVKSDITTKGKRAMGDQFQDKVKAKYILMLNDRIIDGHHYLALAKVLGITCSLRVLDLTPIRFQEKRGSLINVVKRSYGQDYNSRKGGSTTPRRPGISLLPRRERAR